MISWGDLPLGAVIPFPFTTYGKTNGESITLTGLLASDVEVYKGVSMTQRSSDAGYALMDTDGIDIDGVTGFHGFSIDTGDNSDAGFFVAGSFYTVLVSAVTIDSQTVNFVAGTFRLVAAEATAGVPVTNVTHAAGTAWNSGAIAAATLAANAINAAKLDPDVTTELQAGLATAAALATVDGIVDDILLDTAEIGTAGAGLTNINLPNQTMDIVGNVTGNLSGSVGSVSGAVGSVTGAVGSVTGNVGGNVVGSVASVTAGVTLAASAVQAIWDALTSALTTVGSIGKLLVDRIDAVISSRASQTSVDDLPTNAELATSQAAADDATLAAIAALNNLSAGGVRTELATELGRIDVAVSSRLATAGYTAPPAAATNASAVRTELTTELGRIDATISSRATPAQVNTEADTALVDVGLTSVVTGRIDAAVSTRATPAQVATELATYDAPTKAELDAAVALLATAANLATLDARFTGARSEPAQGAPAANASALAKLDFVYKLARNRITQDATTLKVYADDAVTVDHKATVSDSGTLYDRGEIGTGP